MMTMAISKSNPNIPPARVDCTKCDTPTAAPAYSNPGPRRESKPLKFSRREGIEWLFARRGNDGEGNERSGNERGGNERGGNDRNNRNRPPRRRQKKQSDENKPERPAKETSEADAINELIDLVD